MTDSIEQREREQFEEFVKRELGDVPVMDNGRYVSMKINNYWRTWQEARRAALSAPQAGVPEPAKRALEVLGMFQHHCPNVTGHRGGVFVCQRAGGAVSQNSYCAKCECPEAAPPAPGAPAQVPAPGDSGAAVAVPPAELSGKARQAVATAYGHLWHVNNESAAPIPVRRPETAAYEARKVLRDLLTNEERGQAINEVGRLLGRYVLEIDTSGVYPEWTTGPSRFKDWCSRHFGPDADEAYLATAVHDLPFAAPPAPAEPSKAAPVLPEVTRVLLKEDTQVDVRVEAVVLDEYMVEAGREDGISSGLRTTRKESPWKSPPATPFAHQAATTGPPTLSR